MTAILSEIWTHTLILIRVLPDESMGTIYGVARDEIERTLISPEFDEVSISLISFETGEVALALSALREALRDVLLETEAPRISVVLCGRWPEESGFEQSLAYLRGVRSARSLALSSRVSSSGVQVVVRDAVIDALEVAEQTEGATRESVSNFGNHLDGSDCAPTRHAAGDSFQGVGPYLAGYLPRTLQPDPGGHAAEAPQERVADVVNNSSAASPEVADLLLDDETAGGSTAAHLDSAREDASTIVNLEGGDADGQSAESHRTLQNVPRFEAGGPPAELLVTNHEQEDSQYGRLPSIVQDVIGSVGSHVEGWRARRTKVRRAEERVGVAEFEQLSVLEGVHRPLIYFATAASSDWDKAAVRTRDATLTLITRALDPRWLAFAANLAESVIRVGGPTSPQVLAKERWRAERSNAFDLGSAASALTEQLMRDSASLRLRRHNVEKPHIVVFATEPPYVDSAARAAYSKLLESVKSVTWLLVGDSEWMKVPSELLEPASRVLNSGEDAAAILLSEVLTTDE